MSSGNRGGETQGNRSRMDGLTRQLVEGGTAPDRARTIARDCALRSDGDLPGGASRRDISPAERAETRKRANNLGS